jgi:hypothetical protein
MTVRFLAASKNLSRLRDDADAEDSMVCITPKIMCLSLERTFAEFSDALYMPRLIRGKKVLP